MRRNYYAVPMTSSDRLEYVFKAPLFAWDALAKALTRHWPRFGGATKLSLPIAWKAKDHPVCRRHGQKPGVPAFKTNRSRSNQTQIMKPERLAANISDAKQICVDLLITDTKVGLTLLDLAETTGNTADRSRRIRSARKAYRSILSLLARLRPRAEEAKILSKNLQTIKARLWAAERGHSVTI